MIDKSEECDPDTTVEPMNPEEHVTYITKLQAVWRGYKMRKLVEKARNMEYVSHYLIYLKHYHIVQQYIFHI